MTWLICTCYIWYEVELLKKINLSLIWFCQLGIFATVLEVNFQPKILKESLIQGL